MMKQGEVKNNLLLTNSHCVFTVESCDLNGAAKTRRVERNKQKASTALMCIKRKEKQQQIHFLKINIEK